MVASTSTLRTWWAPACRGPWATVALNGAGKVSVRPAVVEAVKALNLVLKTYGYVTRAADTGAYNCRRITGGTGYSLHAYGIAVDINWQTNQYGRTLRTDMFKPGDHRMPYRIQDIRTNNGRQVLRWGGLYSGNKDPMHFEVVCSPADLRTGINWKTVHGYVSPPAAPTAKRHPVLSEGSKGLAVRELQNKLNVTTGSKLKVDGNFGPATVKAVIGFQAFFKVHADGIVGPKTWSLLDYAYAHR